MDTQVCLIDRCLMSNDDVTVSSSSGEDAPPLPQGGSDRDAVFPTLAGITDIIANNIPSLAGFATSIGGSAPSAPTAPTAPEPQAPPSIDSLVNSIGAHIPTLAGAASVVANPAAATLNPTSNTTPVPTANTGTASLDSIVNSLANIPSLAGIVNSVANPAVNSTTTPSAPPQSAPPPSLQRNGDAHTGTVHQSINQSELRPVSVFQLSWKSNFRQV